MKVFIGIFLLFLALGLQILWFSFGFYLIIIGIIILIIVRPMFYFPIPTLIFFPFKFIFPVALLLIFQDKINNFKRTYSNNSSSGFQDPKHQHNLSKYYDILESKDTDTFQTIKSNYRRLIKKYHYDSLASKNLSKKELDSAEKITKKLNEAYSIIKKIKEGK